MCGIVGYIGKKNNPQIGLDALRRLEYRGYDSWGAAVFNPDKGEIFYFQKRIGFQNRMFKIIKFSTMLKNAENLPGGTITLRNDTRVTKSGRILRITKLNELPQLFNVLIGEMSFVGPRPLMKKGFEMYPEDVRAFIYQSKPGITGISSVIFRDEEKMVTESEIKAEEFYRKFIFPNKGFLEKWYAQHKSFLVDLKILLLTAIKILFPGSRLESRLFKNLPKIDLEKF